MPVSFEAACPCSTTHSSGRADPARSVVTMSDTDALRFVKGHGTQNDFVVLADPAAELDLGVDVVRSATGSEASERTVCCA